MKNIFLGIICVVVFFLLIGSVFVINQNGTLNNTKNPLIFKSNQTKSVMLHFDEINEFKKVILIYPSDNFADIDFIESRQFLPLINCPNFKPIEFKKNFSARCFGISELKQNYLNLRFQALYEFDENYITYSSVDIYFLSQDDRILYTSSIFFTIESDAPNGFQNEPKIADMSINSIQSIFLIFLVLLFFFLAYLQNKKIQDLNKETVKILKEIKEML